MGREWKPGDVAIVTAPNGTQHRAARKSDGSWFCLATGDPACPDAEPVRPLVVIDPDDREQVQRLTMAYRSRVNLMTHSTDTMQYALRSLADPPKPPEPSGLGAVVEEADGHLWVRLGAENGTRDPSRVWADASSTEVRYADINVARVLSEGVTL